MLHANDARKRALITLRQEELEDAGVESIIVPDNMHTWEESDIVAWFEAMRSNPSGSSTMSPPQSTSDGHTKQTSTKAKRYHIALPTEQLHELTHWVPKLQTEKLQKCSLLVLCFHAAGCAEDMYSGTGTGKRKTVNPLQEWCSATDAVLMAFQLPGRAQRYREGPLGTLQELAAKLAPLLLPLVHTGVPYVVIGHSMGAWACYELLRALEAKGAPGALHAFLSAMPAPDLPLKQRPWQQQRNLDENAFQDECKEWDVAPVVFSGAMWPMYHQLMRNDFKLFDEYVWGHAGKAALPLHTGATLHYGQTDRRITQTMVTAWKAHVQGPHEVVEIDGHHLWPLQPERKVEWMQHISVTLQRVLSSVLL